MTNQKDNNEKADDAYNAMNELMGELHAARTTFYLASDKFLNSPKVKGLKESMGETTRVYMRRIATGAFASAMYKYMEVYDELLKPIGCGTDSARALKSSIPADSIDKLRHTFHHIVDEETKRYQPIEKVDALFDRINQAYPDLFEKDISDILTKLNTIRDELRDKYPHTNTAVARRHE